MNIRRAVIIALLGLLAAGCRSDPSRDLLERDNFHKEQEIYQLKCRIEDLEAQLGTAAASAPPAVTRPAVQGEMLSEPGRLEAAPTFTAPAPSSSQQAPEGPSLPNGGPLRVTPGVEVPGGEGPGLLRPPSGNGTGRFPPQGNMYYWQPASVRLAGGAAPADDNRAVMQITLHPALTGGIGSGESGDQGLLVVVEPRDQAGNIVVAPGKTSVALIDPALQGERARFARWDFSAAQTARMLHTGSEPGIHLRLPWRSSPAHDRMKVYVRYTTRDGRMLQAERTIAVALGGDGANAAERAEARERDAGPWTADRPQDQHRPLDPRDGPPQRPQWSPDRD